MKQQYRSNTIAMCICLIVAAIKRLWLYDWRLTGSLVRHFTFFHRCNITVLKSVHLSLRRRHFSENVMSSIWKVDTSCLQALLNNSYLYHLAHGKDFESRGIESKKLCLFLKISAGHFMLWCLQVQAPVQLRWRSIFLCYICRTMLNLTIRHPNPLVTWGRTCSARICCWLWRIGWLIIIKAINHFHSSSLCIILPQKSNFTAYCFFGCCFYEILKYVNNTKRQRCFFISFRYLVEPGEDDGSEERCSQSSDGRNCSSV